MEKRELRRILEELSRAPSNPGYIAGITGIPRYDVLASFHILEMLGFIKPIYARGTHKVYTVTELGLKLLQGLIIGGFELDIRLPETRVDDTQIPHGAVVEQAVAEAEA